MKVSRISAEEFIALNQHKQPIIVDVRTPVETSDEYIANSLFLPLHVITPQSFEQKLSAISHEDKSEKIYLLCQRGIRADAAVKKLASLNRFHLVVIEGGLNALKAKGLKAVKGDSVGISLQHQKRIASVLLLSFGIVLGLVFNVSFYTLSVLVGLNWLMNKVLKVCVLGILLTKMPWNH